METSKTNNFGEINLKNLFRKIYDRKLYFAASLMACIALAYFYTKIATPIYEVSTSLMLDPSGKNRQLGESRYVDGGVGSIDTEKNLYNEIAILKSYSLIEQALQELDFGVSYHSKSGLGSTEHYGHFPIKVKVDKSKPQLYGVPFQIMLTGPDKFILSLDAKKFSVSTPNKNTSYEVKTGLVFSKTYSFGEKIEHEYFNLTIDEPSYPVNLDDFQEKELTFQLHSLSSLANDYYEKLKVEQVDIQASILTLNISGPSSDKEIAFLNALSTAFINRELLERDEIAANKEDFIRTQLQSISDSLSKAENKLQNFKQGASAVDLTRTASNALDQLQKLESDKGQLSLNVKYYRSLLQYVNNTDAIDKIVAPSVAGINDPLLSENLLELKRLHAEKTRLEFYKGAKSYDLVLLSEQITNTTNSLKENIRNLIDTETLKLNDRDQRITRLESTISQLPVNEQRLVNFERDNTLYGNMYNYLNQELTKTGIAKAENTSDTKIIDKPRQLGDGPVAPQKMLLMLLAAIIGFIIPLIGIIFSNSALESIHQAGQIEDFSTIPLLSQVGTFNTSLSTLANYKPDWQKDETFRSLSANLQFLVPDQENNVIGLTSFSKGEGKTFCALHLAANYAKAGKKTLLIDLNFRSPVLSRGINKEGVIDLKTYLQNPSYSAEQITQEHPNFPNLFYIITKEPEVNPHQFLSHPRLDTLIAALKYEFDFIIIDSPAIGLVSDYLLLSKHTDINLFIVRKGQVKIGQFQELETLIQKGAMKNPFIVFNGAHKKNNPIKHYTSSGVGSEEEKKSTKWLLRFKKSVS